MLIYHLMSYHEHSLKRESTTTKLEQVFKGGSKQINDHNLQTFVSISFLTTPVNLREPFQMMAVLM